MDTVNWGSECAFAGGLMMLTVMPLGVWMVLVSINEGTRSVADGCGVGVGCGCGGCGGGGVDVSGSDGGGDGGW